MQEKTDKASKDKVLELIKDVDYAMLGTREGGSGTMHSRPMAFRAADFAEPRDPALFRRPEKPELCVADRA